MLLLEKFILIIVLLIFKIFENIVIPSSPKLFLSSNSTYIGIPIWRLLRIWIQALLQPERFRQPNTWPWWSFRQS